MAQQQQGKDDEYTIYKVVVEYEEGMGLYSMEGEN